MKTLLFAALTLISTITFAQQKVTWEGGTPGKETSWNEPRNWSNNTVPNEFSDVIIPNVSTTTFSNPVIKKGQFELNSIKIESNGYLTVDATAKLVVYTEVIGLANENVILEGALLVMDEITDSMVVFEKTKSDENQ
ncbi:MAG: hypothetical protein NXI23_11270 [Bacteroidetes bacterium]|nr:hypothetical protein [Bacteroidota bacterium]